MILLSIVKSILPGSPVTGLGGSTKCEDRLVIKGIVIMMAVVVVPVFLLAPIMCIRRCYNNHMDAPSRSVILMVWIVAPRPLFLR